MLRATTVCTAPGAGLEYVAALLFVTAGRLSTEPVMSAERVPLPLEQPLIRKSSGMPTRMTRAGKPRLDDASYRWRRTGHRTYSLLQPDLLVQAQLQRQYCDSALIRSV